MPEEPKWYKNPQGIAAALSILAVALTFFFVREKRDWEQSARISAIESRGESAITKVDLRIERIEQSLLQLRDHANAMERRIDHLEYTKKEIKESDGQN